MARTQLNVEMDAELLKRLKLVAVKRGTPVAEIVRGLVLAYVAKKETENV